MVGLANAITTSIIERTREIGVLRCIGARARDVRRIFATEGVTLALAGWLLGIPSATLLDRVLVWLVWEVVDVRHPGRLPALERRLSPWPARSCSRSCHAALPIRRAVRLRPGDALRYA